ncbi:MAG TPA: DUF1127 domain-containing protein [Lichenihabitans sp.]|jgi:uncharacterized protein YjiS (DUF1127 family)|nr:DUF1127 domain-containing protein [Lichenihabitans sp.]
MTTTLSRWLTNARIAHQRRRAAESLSRLSDDQLLDVGLERGAIEDYVQSGLPFVETVSDDGRRAFAPSLQGCG